MRTGSVVFALVSLGLLSRAVLAEYPVISTIALSGPGHAWSGQPAFDAGSETPFGASLSYPFAWPVLDQHNNVFFYGAHTDGSIDLYGLVGGVATKIDGAGTFPPSAPIAASGGYVAYSYQVGADQSIRAGTLSGGVTEIAQIGGGGGSVQFVLQPASAEFLGNGRVHGN